MLDQTYSSSFEVEQIVDEKIIDGHTHYLVKWVGYGHQENTWEPLRHMTHSKDKIRDWDDYKIKQLKLTSNNYGIEALQLGLPRSKNTRRDKELFKETFKNVSNPYRKVLPKIHSLEIEQNEDEKDDRSKFQTIFDQPQLKKLIKTKKSDRKKKELELFEKRLKSRPKVWQKYLQNEDQVIKKANQKIKQVIDKAYGSQKVIFTEQQKEIRQNGFQNTQHRALSHLNNLKGDQKVIDQETKLNWIRIGYPLQDKEENKVSEQKSNLIPMRNQVNRQQKKIEQRKASQLQIHAFKRKRNIFSSSSQNEIDFYSKQKEKAILNKNIKLEKQTLNSIVKEQKFRKNDSMEQSTNFVSKKQARFIQSNCQKNIQNRITRHQQKMIQNQPLKQQQKGSDKQKVKPFDLKKDLIGLLRQMVFENNKRQFLQKEAKREKQSNLRFRIQPETIRLTDSMICSIKRNLVENQTKNQINPNKESNKEPQSSSESIKSSSQDQKSQLSKKIEIEANQSEQQVQINEAAENMQIQLEESQYELQQNNQTSKDNSLPRKESKFKLQQTISKVQCNRFSKSNKNQSNEIKLQGTLSSQESQSQFCEHDKMKEKNYLECNEPQKTELKRILVPFSKIKHQILKPNADEYFENSYKTENDHSPQPQVCNTHIPQPRICKSEEFQDKISQFQPPFDCSISTIEESAVAQSLKSNQSTEENLITQSQPQILMHSQGVVNYSSLTNHISTALPESSNDSQSNNRNMHLNSQNLIRLQSMSTRASWNTIRTGNNAENSNPTQYIIRSQSNNQSIQEQDQLQEVSKGQQRQAKSHFVMRSSNEDQDIYSQQFLRRRQRIQGPIAQIDGVNQNNENKGNLLSLEQLLQKVHNASIQLENSRSIELDTLSTPKYCLLSHNEDQLIRMNRNWTTDTFAFHKRVVATDQIEEQKSLKNKLPKKIQTNFSKVVCPQKKFGILWQKIVNKVKTDERNIKTGKCNVDQKSKSVKSVKIESETQEEQNSQSSHFEKDEQVTDQKKFILVNDLSLGIDSPRTMDYQK